MTRGRASAPHRPGGRFGRRAAALAPFLVAPLLAAPASASAQQRGGAEAWAIEAAGATVGSLAGFGAGLLLVDEDDCGDDLGCIFSDVAVVLLTASAGSTLGDWAIGERTDTGPSVLGAAIGSVAGAAAGLGFLKVLEEIDPTLDDGVPAMVSFSIAQGIVTALGSRIGAALR